MKSMKLFFVLLLFVLFTFQYAHAIAPNAGDHSKAQYAEGELLVKFNPGVRGAEKNKAHISADATVIREFPSLGIVHVALAKGQSVEDAISIYARNPNIAYAEPNYIVSVDMFPNDPKFNNLWGLHNIGLTGGTYDADIDAPESWDVTTGIANTVVAVIDTGMDYNHEDLSQNVWVNAAEYNGTPGVDDDANGYVDDVYGIDTYNHDSDPYDDHSHGTHVSGTIGAIGNNGIGVVGVNWNVRILPCKFLSAGGSGYTSGAVECLQYIKALKDRGENIIATNNSWGGGGYSLSLEDAINAQRNVLFIASAGNNGSDNDSVAYYPASYYLPNLIAVAATAHNDIKASFSNYGKYSVHLGAPGVSIYSTIPGNSYTHYSGTSMASPHVTGVAGLLKSSDANRDWIQIKNLLLSGGDDNPNSLAGRTVTGKRLNAYNSLTCSDMPVFAILKTPDSIVSGQSVTLSALSIDCDASVGPVTVTWSGGETVDLFDDGIAPDLAANDGIFSASWTPSSSGGSLVFNSPFGSTTPNDLSITTYSLPDVKYMDSYSQGLTATGGIAPYTWSIVSGSLPPGLTLDGVTGVISGAPSLVGTFNFTVQVTDSSSQTDVASLSIKVYDISIVTNVLPKADIGIPYNEVIEVSGGTAPYTWSVVSGSMPDGLLLDSATGIISGTPSIEGTSTFVVQVVDSLADTATQQLSIEVLAYLALVWESRLDGGNYDIGEDIAVDGAGNVLVIAKSSNGMDYDYLTLKYDSEGTLLWSRAFDGGGEDKPHGIAVDSQGNVYVTGESEGVNYYDYVTVKYDPDGNELGTWRYDNIGSEHAWDITVDNNDFIYVTGRNRAANWYTIKYDTQGNEVMTLLNSDGYIARSIHVDGDGYIYIAGENISAQAIPGFMTVKYDAVGNIIWTRTYDGGSHDYVESMDVDTNGNVYVAGRSSNGSYSYGVIIKYDTDGNQLWMKVDDKGYPHYYDVIAVDPLGYFYTEGWQFAIIKHDPDGNELWEDMYFSGGVTYGIKVDKTGVIYATGSKLQDVFTAKFWQNIPVIIPTDSLPNAMVSTSYSAEIGAYGGKAPYTWSITQGSLPDGIAFDPSTGILSGIPTVSGTFDITAQVTDQNARTASKQLSLVVNRMYITTASLGYAVKGSTYDKQLAATNGTPPYTWSVASGVLPNGLTLDGPTGSISGTPMVSGSFGFTVSVIDSDNIVALKNFTLPVYDPLQTNTETLPDGMVGDPYSQTLTVSGGLPPYTWSIAAGTLPDGLTLDSATGEISGTPTTFGSNGFTIEVMDANSETASKDLRINIGKITSYHMLSASNCSQAVYTRGVQTVVLSTNGSDCPAEDTIQLTFRGGPKDMLIGYLANGGYPSSTTITGEALGSSLTFLNTDSGGTGYVRLVEVDPSSGAVVRELSSVTIGITGGVPGTVGDISSLQGTVNAGNTFGIMLSMSSDSRSTNEIKWGRQNGGPGLEQWFAVSEVPGSGVPLNQSPVASANGPYDGTTGTPIAFVSTGSSDPDGDPITYLWDFGDGNTSTAANPMHTYSSANTYTVTLVVTDTSNASDSVTTTATVTDEANQSPVAVTNGPFGVNVGQNINVRSDGSYDPDGDPITYLWDFGDGNTSTQANTTHAYSAPGTYTITLTVTDSHGASDMASTYADIYGSTNEPPVADAGPDQSGVVRQVLSFDGLGSSDGDGTISGYSWDFGDDKSAGGAVVTHDYKKSGVYTVTLTVTDNDGATAQDTTVVTITR